MSVKDDHEPRWNIVNKLYSKIDKTLDTAFVDNKSSFIEVEIVMLMVTEKISQQKHEMYALYLQQRDEKEEEKKADDKDDDEKKDAPDHLYRLSYILKSPHDLKVTVFILLFLE